MKFCKNCDTEINDLNKIITGKGYIARQCKYCAAIEKKKWKDSHKESCAKKDKEWRLANNDHYLNTLRQYYKTNKDDLDFIAARKVSNARYYINNKQRCLDSTKNYIANNLEKVRVYRREYDKERKINDLNFKIAKNLRSRLSHAVRENRKSGSAIRDLGCTIDFLKQHLESHF